MTPISQGRWPLFVTGSPRSGTSIFALALRLATKVDSYNEGHFLKIYPLLEDGVDRFYERSARLMIDPGHAITHIEKNTVKNEILEALFKIMNSLHGGEAWVDKSGGIDTLKFLAAAAGAGKKFFVFFMYRRAIENVYSRLEKFPQHGLRYHAQDWTATMRAWREIRPLLPADSFMEVEQRSLVTDPAGVSAAVGASLGWSAEEEARMLQVFQNRKPQQLASDVIGRALSMESTGWSPEDQAIFRECVDEEMRMWGFTYGPEYREA